MVTLWQQRTTTRRCVYKTALHACYSIVCIYYEIGVYFTLLKEFISTRVMTRTCSSTQGAHVHS